MPEPRDHAAFLAANRNCVLGTLRADGRARLSPMVYLYDAGTILISTTTTRGGGRTAKRDPRVTVCAWDLVNPMQYLTVYGRADVVEDEAATLRLFSMFSNGGKPLEGDALAKAKQRIVDEGRIVLRITPEEFFPR